MINNKSDLVQYMKEDRCVNNIERKFPSPHQVCWKYLILLRKTEYFTNTCVGGGINRFLKKLYQFRLNHLSIKTGICIPPNTFGKGLSLPHYGTIVVNGSARFGDYCVIQVGVNISADVQGGNYVYLAPGAKVNEKISIADHVIIGSNAVVTRSVDKHGCTVGGVPARQISDKGFYR